MLKPLHDRVIVRRMDAETETKGGIIIPDNARDKPQQGVVLAVGPGVRDTSGNVMPMQVRVGDTVMFTKWAPNEIQLEGEEILAIKESDIIGVVQEQKAA